MKRLIACLVATIIAASAFAPRGTHAATADSKAVTTPQEKGKTCRMEQQCRWENFKKICTYVKVCR